MLRWQWRIFCDIFLLPMRHLIITTLKARLVYNHVQNILLFDSNSFRIQHSSKQFSIIKKCSERLNEEIAESTFKVIRYSKLYMGWLVSKDTCACPYEASLTKLYYRIYSCRTNLYKPRLSHSTTQTTRQNINVMKNF